MAPRDFWSCLPAYMLYSKPPDGDIKVALPELAPKTVANFVGLAKQGY